MTILQKHLVFLPLFLVAMACVLGALIMLLWNWLMPDIFGLPMLDFWQATGLLVLCKLLFGGLGFGGHHHHGGQGHCGHNRLRKRWESMSAEERQQIIEMYRNCDVSNPTLDGK